MTDSSDFVTSALLDDGIGRITFDRIKLRNALNTPMWSAIPVKLNELVRAGAAIIVFSGKGGAFVSGADLGELQSIRTHTEARDTWTAISQALESVANSQVTTMAAIDGPCIGGGCLLSLSCDLRYASARSTFGIPVAKLGIVLDDATVARIARAVGPAKAFEMIARGNLWSAEEALSMGLLNGIFPDDLFDEEIAGIAAQIKSNSHATINATRRSLFRTKDSRSWTHDEAVRSYLSADFKERISRLLANQ